MGAVKGARIVHAGDLSTDAIHDLAWHVGTENDRYQEIAIVGDRVIGSWTYGLDYHRGRFRIESHRTDVAKRYQRKGIARALWFNAIERWRPTKIEASIATDEGRAFLARMDAEISYRWPEIFLWVDKRSVDLEVWEGLCWSEARELLRTLGTTKAPARPRLELVAGGAK